MPQINVTELDFDTIKQNLKTFLSSQDEFSDYDFEGSALSVLIDTLAYNTHYNAMLVHLLANESFLDSAIKRSSVVSLAKAIGYTPRSRRCASANITLKITPDSSYTESTYSLSRDTIFTASVDGTSYTFYPSETVQATLQDEGGVGKFIFTNLILKEGKRVLNKFLISAGDETKTIVIPNKNIDTSTLRVRVQNSGSDFTVTSYTSHVGLLDINSNSKVFFLEETIDGSYSIRFGDNVLGKRLTGGNVVLVDYINTNADDANGARSFQCGTVLTGANESIAITLSSRASSGQKKESIDSIKLNAPRYNSARERGVTASDYKSLILASNSNIRSCAVWGGEENDPPIYGKVFISLDPMPGQVITDQDKENITTSVIAPKGSLSILPEYVNPEYTYIALKVGVIYDPNITTLSSGQIQSAVSSAINTYFSTELNVLNTSMYYSELHNIVKDSSTSIVSVNIIPIIQKRVEPILNISSSYSFGFNSRIQPRELHSTWFDANINGAVYKVKLQDTPNSNVVPPAYNGTGSLFLQTQSGSNVGTVGTIDYSTGKVNINSLNVKSLYGTETHIRVSTRPHDESKDILTNVLTRTSATSTAAVIAKPSKNTVLTLDDSILSAITGSRKGLDISVTAKGY